VALQGYGGALVLISHDRHLLRNTVDEFYLVAGGRVDPFGGTLADYQAWLKTDARPESDSAVECAGDKRDKKTQRQQAARQRQQYAPLQRKLKALETAMDALNRQLATIEQRLAEADIYQEHNKEELQTLLQRRGDLQSSLEQQECDWLDLQEQLEVMGS
jgi:ATP-binding cassette subfamily F protein 3